MIKKNLKPWYPTKEREQQAEWIRKLSDAANHIHHTTMSGHGNWVIVGTDVANTLNSLTTTHTYNPVSYTGVSYYYGTTHTYTNSFVASASTSFITFSG